ncbi:MAG: hypothetical protein ITG02_15055 [Patulibacter sp.]|nr:hypothetical protein [Patulibacter sp.]
MCGRHLLRGEAPEVFLSDGERRDVCELCIPQALFAGWIRVGVGDAPTLEPNRRGGGLKSVIERLPRIGRKPSRPERQDSPARRAAERQRSAQQAAEASEAPAGGSASRERRPHRLEDEIGTLGLPADEPAAPLAAYRTTATGAPAHVTTSGARMAARAVDLYNHSAHPRKLSGIARSLGAPWVTVRPVEGSQMQIVIAWELSWYRFAVDLARESEGVRAAGHGSSLQDLAPGEVEPNAVADEHGYLYLSTAAPTK